MKGATKMRKLTNQELKTLKSLMNDSELKGKGFLNSFILRNTYEPKYKLGDYVVFTELGSVIKGNRVRDFNGQITKISYCVSPMLQGEEYIQYEIYAKDQNGEKYFCCCEEYLNGKKGDRFISRKTNTDINVIDAKSDIKQASYL